jgi:hypothetical protein
MARALFEYELEEHLEEYLQSKQEDGDKYGSTQISGINN